MNEQQAMANNMRAWRRLLDVDLPRALQGIEDAMQRLRACRCFSQQELNQYRSQMLNGAACPGDFTPGQWGIMSRA